MPRYKFEYKTIEIYKVEIEAPNQELAKKIVLEMDEKQLLEYHVDSDSEIDCVDSDEEETGQ